MEDCIFCKIVNKEIPADIIYEDDKVVAFVDIRPVSHGHSLIVPKNHSADIVDTDDKVLADVIAQGKRIALAIQHALNADGFTISTNRGEAAGQTVFHLHFHLIPRYKKDGLKPWTHKDSTSESRKKLTDLIKNHL